MSAIHDLSVPRGPDIAAEVLSKNQLSPQRAMLVHPEPIPEDSSVHASQSSLVEFEVVEEAGPGVNEAGLKEEVKEEEGEAGVEEEKEEETGLGEDEAGLGEAETAPAEEQPAEQQEEEGKAEEEVLAAVEQAQGEEEVNWSISLIKEQHMLAQRLICSHCFMLNEGVT